MRTDRITLSTLPPVETWWPRFAEKFTVADDGCWIWTAYIGQGGYGRFGIKDRVFTAHRVAYTALVGPIPEGMSLDHTCHTGDKTCPGALACIHRRCVNPAHMEPVTLVENVMRGMGPIAQYARATHCKNGHPFEGENLYEWRGTRNWKTCRLAAQRRSFQRRGPIPVKPSKAQALVLATLQAGGSIRQENWQHFVLCRPGDGEPIRRLSTGTPASLVKRGWAIGPDVLNLQVTEAGARHIEGMVV